ncbi:hypothetical protein LAZ67_21000525 [Cordylochernes scorpioides]|uniref:Uncharacterized protein n=1 Tax=Cordylochernes scorpioides TaxID=51811 RepID=A0ABY6LQ94_9ARAC|nr:hypothetical protein LAZ67_21000525 [Cordylochernes scorpioides]
MEQSRKEICFDFIESYPGPASETFKGVITCDETWVYHYDPSSKRQSMLIGKKKMSITYFMLILSLKQILSRFPEYPTDISLPCKIIDGFIMQEMIYS